MLLLGIDLETDGLDPKANAILEVGAVLYDWETKAPVRILSEFIDPDYCGNSNAGYQVPPEITELTGITTGIIEEYGGYDVDVMRSLEEVGENAEFYVGHNCNAFDALFLRETWNRLSMECSKPWLDTTIDIKFPPLIKTRNLRHLAAEHGFLNPFPHRAVFDVLTMFKVMEHYNLDDIIVRSKEPMVYLQAMVSFDEKEKAKERGYHWYAPAKIWWKGMKESDGIAEVLECGFRTQQLSKAPE